MPELRRVAFNGDEGHVGGFKTANHARLNAFFFNTCNHFAQNALMRYADDIDGLRQASRADGDNHFVLLRALTRFAHFRQEAVGNGAVACGAVEAAGA